MISCFNCFVISVKKKNKYKFSQAVYQIDGITRHRGISINKLFALIGGRSNYILSFFAFLIVSLPIPLPIGFSTILALPSVFITTQIIVTNKRIWLPKFIAKLCISKKFIRSFNELSMKYLLLIEKFTKQRLNFITSKYVGKLNDIWLFVFAIFAMIPIPLICIIPAIAGALLSAGLVLKDGLLVIISWIIGLVGIVIISGSVELALRFKDYVPL